MEEHSIVVKGDVLVGNYAELSYGLIARSVIAGEHVKVSGNIISEGDVRIDMWSEITGDVRTKTDAYLGEFVNISGKLFAAGNLDVGNNVKINGGYDVKGWIVVRNPLPVVMFLFLYLMALLRFGNEEEVEKALSELFSDDMPDNEVLSIPNRTKISLEAIKTISPAKIGSHCRLLGNIRARSLSMGNHVTLFGSIRATDDVAIGRGCIVHGNLVSTKGKVILGRNCKILGKISADTVLMHETSNVDGTLTASGGVIIERDDLEGLGELEKRLFYGFTLLEDI
ncbi:MAG: acyltransferase [Candidatus Methanoperedens sp.]|nr:acyltransferase [Candidatus Methanoperedens sp.]MCZ7396489.1 acyltransferase [Candidatus Methanoperedens sp.]